MTMSVAQALRAAAAVLEPVGGTGRLDATLLLEHVTGTERVAFVRDGDLELAEPEQRAFEALVERRRGGVPVAYLIGSAGFYGRSFQVDERVLVPRPETELLVEAALGALRALGDRETSIAEIGTGSGAIAVTLAAELPRAGVVAGDISADALAMARRNAAIHGVAQRCTFVRGDLTAPLHAFAPYDCIVANLPYIPTADVPVRPDPAGFEPRLALDGGADGLELYRRLIAELPPLLAPGASMFFEAAPGTIESLAALVRAAFRDRAVAVHPDYAGLPRFVSA
jgi:release factor glutamine methyltransferase